MCHFVFTVRTAQGEFVLRVAQAGNEPLLASAVTWMDLLRSRGIPTPEVLHADLSRTRHPFAYLVLQRLEGVDLELTYTRLTSAEKQRLAEEMINIQRAVGTLPAGTGFGERLAQAADSPHKSWEQVIASSLERSEGRSTVVSSIGKAEVDLVRSAAAKLDSYFAQVRSTPFLADTTTKNVLVHHGRLSGIVDLDTVCYGDPLFTLALTKAGATSSGFDSVYTTAWQQLLQIGGEQLVALSFYTALFCLDLLSEAGHAFNRSSAAALSAETTARLRHLLHDELRQII